MKKVSVLFLFLLFGMVVHASQVILLSAQIIPDLPLGHGGPKSPIQPPTVYIEDYTLSFVADHPDYILNIKEEDGDVVYTTSVYSAMTQVTLPSTLSGDYEIELVMGNWTFKGVINI